MILLSILIPTLTCRSFLLGRLLDALAPQCAYLPVEILTDLDDGEASTGAKRNRLMRRAQGEWLCHFDDDDLPGPHYAEAICSELRHDPDCVGFRVKRFRNGAYQGEAVHSLRFTAYRDGVSGGRRFFERPPNHLNPIRASIARRVAFPDRTRGEDRTWTMAVRPLLRTEQFIDDVLYEYHEVRGRAKVMPKAVVA